MIPVVCAVLVDAEDHFLAVQRPARKSLAGMWEFPGGKVEDGESPELALRRELLEELDLDLSLVGICEPLTPVTHIYDFATIRLIPFLVRCDKRPALHLVEHVDHCWITTADCELAWAPADIPVLAEVLTRLQALREV